MNVTTKGIEGDEEEESSNKGDVEGMWTGEYDCMNKKNKKKVERRGKNIWKRMGVEIKKTGSENERKI